MDKLPMKPISKDWTPEERIRAAIPFLAKIQDDISRNRYGDRGRPTIAMVEGFLRDPAHVVECYRRRIEQVVAEFESDTEPPHE